METERLSLYGSCVRGSWREGSFVGDSERYVKKGSRNGTPLSMLGLLKGNLEGGFFTGDFDSYVKEGFGNGASLSMKGAWREGSHTEDCERHITEGSGNGAFHFTGVP
jgi:hypothetical protein